MSKRKASDEEDSRSDSDDSRKCQKVNNAIDSDDEEIEDESLKYALKDDDIEGQEDGVADADGDIQFTGFNMKEELEEGHFDKDGMYHWKKEKQIKDSWLDNIDWVKIRQSETTGDLSGGGGVDSDKDSEGDNVNVVECYKKILPHLQPKETIAKALKRLGGNRNLSASERLKLKKSGRLEKELSERNSNSQQLTEITELANKILTETGNMDIYQETYEMIHTKIEGKEWRSEAKEAVLDMYSDDFDAKEKERLGDTTKPTSTSQTDREQTHKLTPSQPIGEVMWEVKRNDKSDNIEGPFTTRQMNDWSMTNHFGERALVRKCGSVQFYSSSRIDFELYL